MPTVRPLLTTTLTLVFLSCTALGSTLARAEGGGHLRAGHLFLSRAVYDGNAVSITAGVTQLPPNCTAGKCAPANAGSTYPRVFNNDKVDASFGVTAKIVLDELKRNGEHVQSLEVPNSTGRGVTANSDQMVTSFPSKSEIALNLSLDRRFVSFMGYLAPVGAIDVSNSNTPAVFDQTNPVTASDFRVVATVDENGSFRFTKTNAYSGNNGRAAILNDKQGANVFYTVGNAGNSQPNGIIIAAGAKVV